MATKKKMLQAAAGNAGGASLDITDVFSTYLYEGNGSTQTITNGIDLDGEGGLVWIKNRSDTSNHYLWDTVSDNVLFSNLTNAGYSTNPSYTALSNGFSILSTGFGTSSNFNSTDYASWTFRKAPKFFDVVTYTGDGNTSQTISHNLGSTPGHMAVKPFSRTGNWRNYHRTIGATGCLFFNLLNATSTTVNHWNNTEPTDSSFTVGINSNLSGETYVAYLFAHNNNDGEFGPDGDQDIIKCGSYTGTGAAGNFIDLGFEPQWVLTKQTSSGGVNWILQDNLRSMSHSDYAWLYPSTSSAEAFGTFSGGTAAAVPNGFVVNNSGGGDNTSGETYIYIAIRRGPLAQPESATEVFDIQDGRLSTVPQFESGFAVDMAINRYLPSSSNPHEINARLTGNQTLNTSATSSEVTRTNVSFDFMDGYYQQATPATANHIAWMWKRAPGFFDVVAYTGNGTAGHTVSHNLGVAPEMMWVKVRNSTYDWTVYHKDTGATDYLELNTTNASAARVFNWNDTEPTAADFTVGSGYEVNRSGFTYISYLFASLPGVSKVGSYTGTGSGVNQDIDCGFTSGAKFVLLKRTNNTGDWIIFDTERGIVVGNDGRLKLNSTEVETFTDQVDPYSGGFSVTAFFNNLNDEYIFYAIA